MYRHISASVIHSFCINFFCIVFQTNRQSYNYVIGTKTRVAFQNFFIRTDTSFVSLFLFLLFNVDRGREGLYLYRSPAVLFSAINKSQTRCCWLFQIQVELHFCSRLPPHWPCLPHVLSPHRTTDADEVSSWKKSSVDICHDVLDCFCFSITVSFSNSAKLAFDRQKTTHRTETYGHLFKEKVILFIKLYCKKRDL